MRRLRSEPPRGPSLGPSDQFTLSRLRAQCGRRVLLPSFCRARRLGRRLTGFRPVRRVSFPAMGKKPMAQATRSYPFGTIHLEDRRGTAQDERSALIFALPPVPHYGGRVPARLCKISGAQNLSGDLRFLPGHWALASPKFQSVRFLFRAWLYRANAPSAHTAVGATLAVALSLPL